jgi:hypothetical protein
MAIMQAEWNVLIFEGFFWGVWWLMANYFVWLPILGDQLGTNKLLEGDHGLADLGS